MVQILEADPLYPGEHTARIANLDADPTTDEQNFSLSLGCIDGFPLARFLPYSLELPPGVDSFIFMIWDSALGDAIHVTNTTLASATSYPNDDNSALVTAHRQTIRDLVNILMLSTGDLGPNESFVGGLWNSSTSTGLWSTFDTAGMDDAFAYLGCY